MLVVQEVNRVKGKAMEQFESMTQELWNVAAATGVQAAWFFEVSHGTGPSYCVVTGMRLPDWAAWESFARAVAFGDLSVEPARRREPAHLAAHEENHRDVGEWVEAEVEEIGEGRPTGWYAPDGLERQHDIAQTPRQQAAAEHCSNHPPRSVREGA